MSKNLVCRALLSVVLLGVASISSFAGSAVIGSVAGSMNTTVGGQPLLPNSVIFSGDSLKVRDGATVIALSNGSRLVFGRDTEASLLRDGNEVTVLLGQGNVSVYHPEGKAELRVKVNNLSIAPAAGFKTLGEVALLNGATVVTSKQGALRVEGNGSPVDVAQGKTITIQPRTARVPRPQGGAQLGGGGSTALEVAAVGAGGAAAILAGIGISRANDAKSAAQAATAAAGQANATAAQADADAMAATAAAQQANDAANAAGCALNLLTYPASPYTPPNGDTCPFVQE